MANVKFLKGTQSNFNNLSTFTDGAFYLTTDTDRLIFGYNKDLIVGVWTGYDDNSPTPNTDRAISQNIWLETIEGCLQNKEDNWYETPNNVVGVLVDPVSGELATNDSKHKKIVYYIKGTEPTISKTPLDDVIPTIKENKTS